MSYHNISSAANTQSKTIKSFNLDTSNVKETGERRAFTISGDKGAVFSLEVRSGDNYYNFETNSFQTTTTRLSSVTIGGGAYTGSIIFPVVSVGAQYDIYLFSETNEDTAHAEYNEVRFSDNSVDINSSTGSNSNLVQKVIYQTLDITLTLRGYSPNGTVTGTAGTQVITTSRGASTGEIPFSFTWTATSLRSLTVDKQPSAGDIFSFVTRTPVATPVDIEGEDLYPAVTNSDVVDGDFGAGTTHKIVMDTNVADKMIVGDRVTTAATTDVVDQDTVNLANGSLIVMDNNVATKMAVGDRITIIDNRFGEEIFNFFNNNLVTVGALNPNDDDAKEFQILFSDEVQASVELQDNTSLIFTSKLDREVFTVAALNPDTDNVKEFSMLNAAGGAGNVGIRDNATLSFSNQRNYRWELDSIDKLSAGIKQLKGIHFTSTPTIREYLVQNTINEGLPGEYKVDVVRVPALTALGLPVATRNPTTKVETVVQAGHVIFSEQALLSFGSGANASLFSYGVSGINNLTDYDVEFSDLAVALTEVTTTTITAPSTATSFNVARASGIAENISTVSGIGIDPSAANPTVTAITNVGGATWDNTGGATLTLSAAQTLESGTTLTFPNASTVATITGNIQINRAGNANVVIYFDLEKFLTMQAAP